MTRGLPLAAWLVTSVLAWPLAAQTSPANGRPAAGTDLGGYWLSPGLAVGGPNIPLTLTPAFQKAFEERQRNMKAGTPLADTVSSCMAFGMPRILTVPFQIVHADAEMLMITEILHEVRRIAIGETMPDDPDPSYSGTSVGRWEGSTLVVETKAIKAKTIDNTGLPHSDALEIVERMRLRDPQALEIQMTLTDPKAFSKPWTVTRLHKRAPAGYRFYEYICTENNRNETLPDGTTSGR